MQGCLSNLFFSSGERANSFPASLYQMKREQKFAIPPNFFMILQTMSGIKKQIQTLKKYIYIYMIAIQDLMQWHHQFQP